MAHITRPIFTVLCWRRFNSVIWQKKKNALASFYFFKPTIKIQHCAATLPLHWTFCKHHLKNFYQTLSTISKTSYVIDGKLLLFPSKFVLMQIVVPLAIKRWHWHISYPPFQVCRALNWHLPCPTWILWLYNVWTPSWKQDKLSLFTLKTGVLNKQLSAHKDIFQRNTFLHVYLLLDLHWNMWFNVHEIQLTWEYLLCSDLSQW